MKKEKRILILGSTGSVGRQTVEVARESSVGVDGLCAHSNITLLEEQIRILHPRFCAVLDPAAAKALKVRTADTSTKVLSGLEGLTRMIENQRQILLLIPSWPRRAGADADRH